MKTKFWLSFLTLTNVVATTQTAQAQTYTPTNRNPVGDSTLGTQVSPTGNNFDITGGLRKGQTLFHSFTDFSVPANGAANFLNPVGNRDIITRVTGGLFSDINGIVNTNGANFFLINPSGIVFGPSATLNVGKAFVGSTANSLDLVGGVQTIKFGTNPNGDAPLLSVAPNVLFDVSRLNIGGGNGAISNFGTLQTNNNSQYIGLIGGNVTLDGSQGGGKMIAPGGRVDIGGLNGAGSVSIDNQGLVFSSNGVGRSNVLIKNDAGIIVRATDMLNTVDTFVSRATSDGSSINISANNIDILNSGAKLSEQTAAIDAGLAENSVQTKPAGAINLNATGKINLNSADIKNTLRSGAEGSIGDIKIQAGALDVKNNSIISTATSGKGNAGNIDINVTGDINISGNDAASTDSTVLSNLSGIASSTFGQGDTGKLTINTQGKLALVNLGSLTSDVGDIGVGNGQGIFINARELSIANASSISSSTFQTTQMNRKGNGGNIDIKTTGDIRISGSTPDSTTPITSISSKSGIFTGTNGQGNAGKIIIDTQNQGKLLLSNRGDISNSITPNAVGNGGDITISAREIDLQNQSSISASNITGRGDAGNIDIKTTGDISISGSTPESTTPVTSTSPTSVINNFTTGQGNAGKITINTQGKGKISLSNRAVISNSIGPVGIGNGQEITLLAKEIDLRNTSLIFSDNIGGQGNAGNIKIKTTGDIKANTSSGISSSTNGRGNAGEIIIDTQNQGNILLSNFANISSDISENAIGNGGSIVISAEAVNLNNKSFISSGNIGGQGDTGNIDIKTKGAFRIGNTSFLTNSNIGQGKTGNILLDSDQQITLDNAFIFATSSVGSGGNIQINNRDRLLLRNKGFISTNSGSSAKNGNGGNITISSPLIIALPGNNDIAADANGGTGGRVNITSKGLFGIQFRPKGKESALTNDITASSTFGRDGNVNIDTPGTDPGRDSTELPNVTTDASNQISQVCSASNRQNKLTVTGRGGLPPTANDPLTSDVVWQDARAADGQPVASSATTNPAKLAAPAVGWVFDGKGKVTLVAAATSGHPTGTSAVCPTVSK